MLQENLYDIRPYAQWYMRTGDFSKVMKRKKLVMTTKAKLLLAWLWVLIAIGWIISFALILMQSYIALLALIILAPYVLAIGLVIPLVIGTYLVQKPREKRIIAAAKQKLQAHSATKIAVVGSFGKTTMKEILLNVLAEDKRVAATPGNMNTPLGISRFIDTLDGSEEVLIFELGEYYPGDIRDLCDLVQPDMGVITGINEAHLERFKTIDRTIATIYELADYLGDKPLWVNGESKLAFDNIRRGAIAYTRKGAGKLKVQHPKAGLEGVDFQIVGGGTKMRLHSDLLGMHNIGPLLAGVGIGLHLGLTPRQIEQGIAKTKPFEHRMQPSHAGGIWTIDDSYNGNPDGARVAIEFLGQIKDHRRVYVTPGLVEVGPATAVVHTAIGLQLAKNADVVVLVKNSATPFIARGLEEGGFTGEVLWYDDGLSCLGALPQITKPGDVVILQNDWSDNYA
jgi:UDP-N-acetylmuramoyl-tripeptide--D-alanyl-D-alanine ligase